jgi:hypothetical protein
MRCHKMTTKAESWDFCSENKKKNKAGFQEYLNSQSQDNNFDNIYSLKK